MKSVYTGTMILFFRGQFWTCFKNGSDYKIYYEIFVQNIASKRKWWYWNNDFFFRVNFQKEVILTLTLISGHYVLIMIMLMFI